MIAPSVSAGSLDRPAPTPTAHRSPLSLAVIVPAYNEEVNLPHLLNFLEGYPSTSMHRPIDMKIWLEVSGSEDRTASIARAWAARWPSVEVVDTGERDGLLLALNRLLASAKGDLVLRMDADVKLSTDTLDSLVLTLIMTGGGIVGPRIVPIPSLSGLVTRLARAEYEIHHCVSLRSPKTTIVQLFRGVPVRLRPDSGVEDQELQSQVSSVAGPARYDFSAEAAIVPPASVRNFLIQRVRTIQHLALHRRRGYEPPSTDTLRLVVPAMLDALRRRSVGRFDLFAFVVAEVMARAVAWLGSRYRAEIPFRWASLADTKVHAWRGRAPDQYSPVAVRPGEDAVPVPAR
jgi:Glycosyl transferase family 2